MNFEHLFENLRVKEIKQQSIKIRSEIERKKEELRFLVSERYRDIIDAADAISKMKICASEIDDSISKMNTYYNNWNDLISYKSVSNIQYDENGTEKNLQLLNFTSQIELIINMTDLIWNAIETRQFSNSVILFNICRFMFIHSQIMYKGSIDVSFNLNIIFNRTWSSISIFESTIGSVCRDNLKLTNFNINTHDVLDSLLGILILEDLTIDALLKEYIIIAEHQIQEWFSPKYSCTPINQQLESVAKVIMKIISIINNLFINNLLLDQLRVLSDEIVKDMKFIQNEKIYHYLPNGIAMFRPSQKAYQRNSNISNRETMIKITREWLERCRDKFTPSFILTFKYLSTINSIGEVRSNLENIFSCKTVEESSKIKEWSDLESENSLKWNIIINDIYSVKLKEIIKENISEYFIEWCTSLEKYLNSNLNFSFENSFDVNTFFNYFWTECNGDIFFHSERFVTPLHISKYSDSKSVFETLYFYFLNFFEIGSSNKTLNFESLVVKFKVIRPEIYQITKVLDGKLFKMIKEVITIINDDNFLWNILQENLISIVDRCMSWADELIPKENLQSNNYLSDLCYSKFYDYKSDVNNSISYDHLKVIILLQSIRTIYEMLPSFQAGFMTSVFNNPNFTTSESEITKGKRKNSRLPFLPSKRLSNHQQDFELTMLNAWFEVIAPLKEKANQLFISGTKSSILLYVNTYFKYVKHGFSSINACDEICSKWIPINVDGHDLNNGITSVPLKAPNQCSWPMHLLLFNISHLMSLFGGHSIMGKSIDGIRCGILQLVIEIFKNSNLNENFQDIKFLQKQSIQLIYDLRYFIEIINAKSGIEKDVQESLKLLLNEIEKLVDPFDFEMMSETLYFNLIQNISKNSSLYWLLCPNQFKKRISFCEKLEIGKNQHNLIDLAGDISVKFTKSTLRFSMLPISGYSSNVNSYKLIQSSSKSDNKMEIKHSDSQNRFLKIDDEQNFELNMQTTNKSYFKGFGSKWF